MFFFDILVNLIIQKMKSKHTSLKKYTNSAKLIEEANTLGTEMFYPGSLFMV
jgi:hypothetical protein